MFYQNPKLFGKQNVLDAIVEDVSLILSLPRNVLNVVSLQI